MSGLGHVLFAMSIGKTEWQFINRLIDIPTKLLSLHLLTPALMTMNLVCI